MTAESDDKLEQALGDLTVWRGPTPNLWRRALKTRASHPARRRALARRILHWRIPPAAAACLAVIAVGVTIAINLPSLSRARPTASSALSGKEVVRRFTNRPRVDGGTEQSRLRALGYVGASDDLAGADLLYANDEEPGLNARGGRGMSAGPWPFDAWHMAWSGPQRGGGMRSPSSADSGDDLRTRTKADDVRTRAPDEPRHVVRQATVELLTNDVRALFLKAQMLVSEAHGEFIQDSALTGTDEDARANLTLRVAADRLPAVLNELRELGEVQSERVTGEDVTSQVVDLEARLRNEQRVEAELLELLEKRQNDELKDILQLRQNIAAVRGEIERMTAQRERLGRLVSLATVLVIIRTDATRDGPGDGSSIGAYFIEGIQTAWRRGLVLLFDTCAVILSVLIGGLIWWIILALAFVLYRSYRRRALASAES